MELRCIVCSTPMPGKHIVAKYCSVKCKCKHRKTNPHGRLEDGHHCRMCGKHFPLKPGQANKWLCSDECRCAANAKSVREFHLRRPLAEALYRQKTKEKRHPDNSNVRFYKLNPSAPRQCEACGEARVTEVAHKPGHERIGKRRAKENWGWPEQVWVLCPTCHRLLDRMNYSPAELGLKI